MKNEIFDKQSAKFIFIRHGESAKNLLNITGGEGRSLTDLGKRQVHEVSKFLGSQLRNEELDIFTSATPQTVETAKIIGLELNAGVIVNQNLAPAGLGIASGLSAKQMEEQMPEIASMFQKWRCRQIEAIDLNVPNIEPPDTFWNRVTSFLNSADNKRTHIVVCTRSIMVFAANFIEGNAPQKGGNYKHVEVANCDVISFLYNTSTGKCEIIKELTKNEYLKSSS